MRIGGRVLVGCVLAATAGLLHGGSARPAVSIEITPPARGASHVSVRLDIVAKIPIRALTVSAYLDKAPLPTPPVAGASLERGERRSMAVDVRLPDDREHWLYVETQAVLQTGELMNSAKSLRLIQGRKAEKTETYETFRAPKPPSKPSPPPRKPNPRPPSGIKKGSTVR